MTTHQFADALFNSQKFPHLPSSPVSTEAHGGGGLGPDFYEKLSVRLDMEARRISDKEGWNYDSLLHALRIGADIALRNLTELLAEEFDQPKREGEAS